MTRLLEMALGAPERIDKEAGIMYGVKILGKVSKNGREYSDNAMAQAKKITEGLGVNLNHPDKKTPNVERSMQDNFGWLEGVETKSDGNYGNLHYLKEHPFAGAIIETAERRPQRFGLSINAEGSSVTRNGKQVVESIERMRSVDIVQNPATTCGLFESLEEPVMNLKQFVESLDAKDKNRPNLIKLLEMDSAMGEAPAPEMPAEATPDDQVKAAFRAMIMAAFDDDSLDTKATLAKMKDIMNAQEKLSDKPGAPVPETPPEGEPPVVESKTEKTDPKLTKLLEELATLRADKARDDLESACRALLESANIEESPAKLKALTALPEADRKPLLESWPKSEPKRVSKPAFSRPILESMEDELPKGKSLVAALKR